MEKPVVGLAWHFIHVQRFVNENEHFFWNIVVTSVNSILQIRSYVLFSNDMRRSFCDGVAFEAKPKLSCRSHCQYCLGAQKSTLCTSVSLGSIGLFQLEISDMWHFFYYRDIL